MTLQLQPPLTDAVVPDLPELAHNGWELATWGIIAITAVCIAAVFFGLRMFGTKVLSEQRHLQVTADEIREHTVNTHETNMRDDLDDAKTAALDAVVEAKATRAHVDILVKEMVEWRKDFGGIREELRDDREMHHKDVERIDRRIDGIDRRIT